MKTLRTYLLIIAPLVGISQQPSFAGYDPTKGRFLSRDPIEESGGVNLYGFVQNRPVSLFDLIGLSVFWLYDSEEKVLNKTALEQVIKAHDQQKKHALEAVKDIPAGIAGKCKFSVKKNGLNKPTKDYEEVTLEEFKKFIESDVIEVKFEAKKDFQTDLNTLTELAKKATNSWDDVGYAIHGWDQGQGDLIYFTGSATTERRAKVFESISKITSASGGVHVAICRPWPKKFSDPNNAWEWSLASAGAQAGGLEKPKQLEGGGFNYRYFGSVMVFEAASEEKPKK